MNSLYVKCVFEHIIVGRIMGHVPASVSCVGAFENFTYKHQLYYCAWRTETLLCPQGHLSAWI